MGFPDQQISVNEDIFAGSAPSLRDVSIERCKVDLESHVFSGLTSLSLSIIDNVSVDDVIRTISRLPDLQQLRLESLLPSASTGTTDLRGVAKVHLPKLESVVLMDPVIPVAALLAHLEFSRSAFVHLNCAFFPYSSITILQPFIEERFDDSPRPSKIPGPPMRHILSLDLEYRAEKDTWSIICGTLNPDPYQTDCLYTMDEYLDTQPLLRLEFKDRQFFMGDGPTEGIAAFCRILPLFHVRQLTTNSRKDRDRTPWDSPLTEALGDAPELRVIELRGSAHLFIRALVKNRTFAPALTNVKLRNVDFRTSCTTQSPEDHYGSCVRCLRRVLADRAQVGLMLQRLTFSECSSIGDDDVKGLREVVGQLEGVVVDQH